MKITNGFAAKWSLLGLALVGCGGAVTVEAEPSADLDAGVYVCGPTTCSGCCQGNACMGGKSDLACGHTGRACRACEVGFSCHAEGAACISVPTDAGYPGSLSVLEDANVGDHSRPRQCFLLDGSWVCL